MQKTGVYNESTERKAQKGKGPFEFLILYIVLMIKDASDSKATVINQKDSVCPLNLEKVQKVLKHWPLGYGNKQMVPRLWLSISPTYLWSSVLF